LLKKYQKWRNTHEKHHYGSGKYEPYVGQKFIGTVTGMLSTGQQMYHVVAAD